LKKNARLRWDRHPRQRAEKPDQGEVLAIGTGK